MPERNYFYHDENGNEVLRVQRTESKDFFQYTKDESGRWVSGLHGFKPPLYHLPDLIKVRPKNIVLFLEGEKDVDRARSLGFNATCNPMGAGAFRDYMAPFFSGLNVLLIADNDEAGLKHITSVGNMIHELVNRVRFIGCLPGLEDVKGGDFSDWADLKSNMSFRQMLATLTFNSVTFRYKEPERKKQSTGVPSRKSLGGTYYERIKARYRLEDVVSSVTNLYGEGNVLTGKCPLHNEQNGRAFVVYVADQKWKCFGKCDARGDVIDFIAECKERNINYTISI